MGETTPQTLKNLLGLCKVGERTEEMAHAQADVLSKALHETVVAH